MMDKIAKDFKEKDVLFYQLYTREPHPEQDYSTRMEDERYDFTEKKQTETLEEREAYAEEMIEEFGQNRPVLIDDFGEDCVQNWLGGGAPNSLAVIDRQGNLVLWQVWSNFQELRNKLEEMTGENSER
jgi:hypothetical protein